MTFDDEGEGRGNAVFLLTGVKLVKRRVGDKTGNIPRMNKLDYAQIGVAILLFHNIFHGLIS